VGPVDKKEQSDGGFRATLPSRRKVYFCRFVPFSPFWAEIGDKTHFVRFAEGAFDKPSARTIVECDLL
jgi:hypothetical protein